MECNSCENLYNFLTQPVQSHVTFSTSMSMTYLIENFKNLDIHTFDKMKMVMCISS